MRTWLEKIWWQPLPPPLCLRPLARLYGGVADWRSARQSRQQQRLPVPVIVVGNIAIGGSGKTPIVLALIEELRALGRTPGVLARGYGGAGPFPLLVAAATDPAACGDEPALIARRSGAPVCVAPDRVTAGRALLTAHPELDVLIADDGLQHLRLHRDLEFCVIDGVRGHGNGWRLPAGPLRDPPARARQCALSLVNGGAAAAYGPKALRFDLLLGLAVNLRSGEQRPLASFTGPAVHALAGIGHPARFFAALRAVGLKPVEHAFADHHPYSAADLAFDGAASILMTEKDAVKCRAFADARCWWVAVRAEFEPGGVARVRQSLQDALAASSSPT